MPVDNHVDNLRVAWIDGGYHVWSDFAGRWTTTVALWRTLLRDRGRLWMVRLVSTALVESFVDAEWRAWIARETYPQPSTLSEDAIPCLPREYPQRSVRRRIHLVHWSPAFMGHSEMLWQ
jgi:hypothetical protein